MKWLLIITLFGADGDVTKVGMAFASQDVCERAAEYQLAFYAGHHKTATYECVPESEFVTKERVR